SGLGSLRQAILDANAAGGATILISNLAGRLELLQPLPALESPVFIRGPGTKRLTISGPGKMNVFQVSPGSRCTIASVTGGDGYFSSGNGAGVFNLGDLILSNCAVLSSVVQTGSGGGIFNGGRLRMFGCTVDSNVARNGSGGGIYNSGTLEMSTTRLSGNIAL